MGETWSRHKKDEQCMRYFSPNIFEEEPFWKLGRRSENVIKMGLN
jgi:hypothetical protein